MIGSIAAAVAVFFADLFGKQRAVQSQKENTVVYNAGFAGGHLSDRPEIIRGVSLAAIGAFLAEYAATLIKGSGKIQSIGMGVALGGALNNLYERLRFGKVTDYIQLKTGKTAIDRYVFNISDVAIVVGTAISFAAVLFAKLKKG